MVKLTIRFLRSKHFFDHAVKTLLQCLLMKLLINGEERRFGDGLTLAALVDQLGVKADRVAVELNRNIVRRDEWARTMLHDGDRLEVVHFVGGGSLVIPSQREEVCSLLKWWNCRSLDSRSVRKLTSRIARDDSLLVLCA